MFLNKLVLLLERYLKRMDFKTTNIEGIRIDDYSLKGIHVDMYQAIALASLLGIIVD